MSDSESRSGSPRDARGAHDRRGDRGRRLTVAAGGIGAIALVLMSLQFVYTPLAGRAGPENVSAALFGRRVVAITIDDGPSARITPQILRELESHGVSATFFVVGRSAVTSPALVREEITHGNIVGTHTWSHPRLDRLTDERARDEVMEGALAVKRITGRMPAYFRPPRGVMTAAVAQAAADLGMRVVFWDVSLSHIADTSARASADRVLSRLIPGDIVLVHDGPTAGERQVEALSLLLDGLPARGFRVVPLDRLSP